MSCPITIALKYVEQYQTLIAGVLAFVGAWWTVRKLSAQIRQSGLIENERRERSHMAARTVMPAALSELDEYASACLRFLEQFHLNPNASGVITAALNIPVPSVPAETLLTLRECIQFGDQSVAELVADMISKIQIQNARLISTTRRLNQPGQLIVQRNIDTYVVDALEIRARAFKLLPYARRAADASPATPTVDDIREAARLSDIDERRTGVYDVITLWTPNQERL